MSVFSESTIGKFREAMTKIIKERNCLSLFKNPQEIWNRYHIDIASNVFYELEDEMHKYSSFEDAEEPGTEDYKLWDEFEDELKPIFIQIAQEYLTSTSHDSETANTEEIIRIAKKMSPEDIKKTISRLLNMI